MKRDVQSEGFRLARELLTRETNNETAAGWTEKVLVEVDISGGGPSSWLDLTWGDRTDYENGQEPDAAVFTYADGSDSYRYRFSTDDLPTLWERLNADPDEDDDEG